MAGSVKSYTTQAGRRWMVRYRKPDRSSTDKRGFLTKKDAETFLASVTMSKASGDYIDPALSRVRVRELAETWLDGKRPPALKPSAFRPLEIAWTLHVEPKWGDRELRSLVPSEIQTWVTRLGHGDDTTAGKSASVVLRALGVLAGIIDMAIDDGRLKKNPARGLKNLPRKTKRKPGRSYLTIDQLQSLAVASRFPTLVLVLGYTGLRWGEATALRVRHVNALRRRLHVEENAVQVDGVIHVGEPKSWERRSVTYPKFLGPKIEALCVGKRPDDLVFGDGVTYLRPSGSGTGWFEGAVTRVQLDDEDFPRITPHDLRHTAASIAIRAGANVKAVQHMLGHESAAMTLDTYADLFPDDLDDVANKLDELTLSESVGKAWAVGLS